MLPPGRLFAASSTLFSEEPRFYTWPPGGTMIGARRCRTSTTRLCQVSYIALLHVARRAMAAAPLLPQQRAVLPYMVFPKPNPCPTILRNPRCLLS